MWIHLEWVPFLIHANDNEALVEQRRRHDDRVFANVWVKIGLEPVTVNLVMAKERCSLTVGKGEDLVVRKKKDLKREGGERLDHLNSSRTLRVLDEMCCNALPPIKYQASWYGAETLNRISTFCQKDNSETPSCQVTIIPQAWAAKVNGTLI